MYMHAYMYVPMRACIHVYLCRHAYIQTVDRGFFLKTPVLSTLPSSRTSIKCGTYPWLSTTNHWWPHFLNNLQCDREFITNLCGLHVCKSSFLTTCKHYKWYHSACLICCTNIVNVHCRCPFITYGWIHWWTAAWRESLWLHTSPHTGFHWN